MPLARRVFPITWAPGSASCSASIKRHAGWEYTSWRDLLSEWVPGGGGRVEY